VLAERLGGSDTERRRTGEAWHDVALTVAGAASAFSEHGARSPVVRTRALTACARSSPPA